RKYLPREQVEVAHKTGTVRGVVNDAGIIFPSDKDPYILCCFTKGLQANSEGEEAIATVSKISYEYWMAKCP
nr:serine hydrolase [Candidatus Njordarchaeum guaymaensis]